MQMIQLVLGGHGKSWLYPCVEWPLLLHSALPSSPGSREYSDLSQIALHCDPTCGDSTGTSSSPDHKRVVSGDLCKQIFLFCKVAPRITGPGGYPASFPRRKTLEQSRTERDLLANANPVKGAVAALRWHLSTVDFFFSTLLHACGFEILCDV